MMKKFIGQVAAFLVCFLLAGVFCLGVIIYMYEFTDRDIPAFNFSNNYSFNEKIVFIGNASRDTEVIILGSSIALNNLHSETVTRKLESKRILNTAAWGMTMVDDYSLLKSLHKTFEIKTLLMVSNIIDFKQIDKKIDVEFVEHYLNHDKMRLGISAVKKFSLKYYIRNLKYAHRVRNCIDDYECLKYDAYGSVNLQKGHIDIDKGRWVKDDLERPGLERQYNYLDSISDFCRRKGIELVFCQSPLRQELYAHLDKSKRDILNSHIEKVRNTLEVRSHLFINSNDKLWADSLFADGTHLNEEGARLFTEFCVEKMNK